MLNMIGAMWNVRGMNKTCGLQRTADFIISIRIS
jgi:hypothetical protein